MALAVFYWGFRMGVCDVCTSSKSVKRVIAGAVGIAQNALGINQSDDDVYQARLVACASCDYLKRVNGALPRGATVGEKDECLACGCPVRDKARLETQKCPIKRWDGG